MSLAALPLIYDIWFAEWKGFVHELAAVSVHLSLGSTRLLSLLRSS